MSKELEEAIKYLKLIRKNHDLEKNGYVYTEEAIETVLNYIDNSISKEKIKKKIEELNENGYWDYLEERDLEKTKNILQELLEGK